ncbi:putative ELM2 domain-containing protein [Medicago truncatula]|uniref:Putative ELM2 domain-containing protein n=1 Tax=Medicago truncatula TaxID=3880 RepID=A0A396H1N9_MEDTR|nr:putative ELM2 domain-containing protein [Medicago truncatula]
MICFRKLAIKDCDKKSSHHRRQNQIHEVVVPLNSKSKRHKRKFDRYIYDSLFTTSFKLISREKYGSEKAIDQTQRSLFSQEANEIIFPTLDDEGEYCATCTEDYSHLSESKDSIKVLNNPKYQGSLKIQHRDKIVSDSFSLPTKSSLKDKPKIDFVKALKSVDDRDLTGGKTSLPLSSTEEDMELVRSFDNFLTARCNHIPRPIIPIGPRFQAKIPKWEDGTYIKLGNDDDGLKWLGTQIWPIPFISETNI